MGVIVTRETVDGMYHFYTVEADTTDPTPRRPAVDAARRAWERLWSNECLDARSRAMAKPLRCSKCSRPIGDFGCAWDGDIPVCHRCNWMAYGWALQAEAEAEAGAR
jgi:hypothetical protein